MDRLDDDSCSSESVLEEVVDLEDEDSSDGEVEYIEEVVDDSSDSSIMEELPPPISIPKELQVKDSDDEQPKDESSESDSNDSDDSEPPLSSSARPSTTRGTSFLTDQPAQPAKKERPKMQPIEDFSTNNEESEGDFHAPPEPIQEKPSQAPPAPSSSNTAKPIAVLHGRKNVALSSPTRECTKTKEDASSPEAASVTASQPPKSAPTKAKKAVGSPPVAGARDDDKLGTIEWKKPDWTTKKVLRDTSKRDKLMSGKDLGRPIGGIRPVDDSA